MLRFAPEEFVPSVLDGYLSDSPRWFGSIKNVPEDFVVEEMHTHTHYCTVKQTPDLPPSSAEVSEGQFVSVTLVKRQLTTYDACRRVKDLLGIDMSQITWGGNKDRWALTAQRITISGVTLEQVQALCRPSLLHGTGFFLKDATRARYMLKKGHLVGNRFTLRIGFAGKAKAEIEEYLAPRLAKLEKLGWLFPNFYNRQRLGFRQNLVDIGYTAMLLGSAAAIKRYLTETSDLESARVTEVRRRLLQEWEEAELSAEAEGVPLSQRWIEFDAMLGHLCEYESLNMANEHTLVEEILKPPQSFDEAMRRVKDEISAMWFGAYQGLWFNQALAMCMQGQLLLDDDGRIPLYIKEENTENWYRNVGLAQAIVERVDPSVKRTFLSAPTRKRVGSGHPHSRRAARHRQAKEPLTPGPRRKAFHCVRNPESAVEDGCWMFGFDLPSGGYATTVLQSIVDLDGERVFADERSFV